MKSWSRVSYQTPVEQPSPKTLRVKPRRVPAPTVPRRREPPSGPSITGAPSFTTSTDLAQDGAGAAAWPTAASAETQCGLPATSAAMNKTAARAIASIIGGSDADRSIFVAGVVRFTPQAVAFGELAEVVAGKAGRARAAADVVAVLVEHRF